MTTQTPFWEARRALFEEKIAQFQEEKKILKKQTNKFGTVRVLFFWQPLLQPFISSMNAMDLHQQLFYL